MSGLDAKIAKAKAAIEKYRQKACAGFLTNA
jgi:hypothetical protein